MADRFQLKSATTEGLRPSPEYLLPGELALNLNSETPGLFFKDTENNIRKVGPAQYSNNPPTSNSIGEIWINPLAGDAISIWDGSDWVTAGAVGYISETAPEEPQNGQLWYDLDDKKLKTYVSEDSRWVYDEEEGVGTAAAANLYLGLGNNSSEIFVDPYIGSDSFLNRGNDPRFPFKTLNRAVIEATKISIKRGTSNDEIDKVLIRVKNGDNVVLNGLGVVSADEIEEGRKWSDKDYHRFIDGANLLIANKDWIASKAFNSLSSAYFSEYSDEDAFRDRSPSVKTYLSNLVLSVAADLKANGNQNVLKFSKSFYNGDGQLIAFGDDFAIKDLFISVAYPIVVERVKDAIANKGAFRDNTITPDTSESNPCSNVEQSALTLLEVFSRTLSGSLSLGTAENPGDYPTEPDEETLQAFNDPFIGGLIIPRGVSIQGADLRKCNIIPSFVPDAGQEEGFSIFKLSGGSFCSNFSLRDNPDTTSSHHRLKCFSYATKTELNLLYDKVAKVFELDEDDIEVRSLETNIVFDETDVDSVDGSSPYIFNCSLRSEYGLCGVEADGALVQGFKSFHIGQFTIISLQKDFQAWEIYDGTALDWRTADNYQEVIETDIEDVRIKANYRHFGIKAKNGAYSQVVSCFVIGSAVNYWTETGGNLSITNSNSDFGGTSCLAEGFLGQGTSGGALDQDKDFAVEAIIRPLELEIEVADAPSAQATRIRVGVFQSFTEEATYIDLVLEDTLFESSLGGYTISPGTIVYFTDVTGTERTMIAESFPQTSLTNPDDLGNVLRLDISTDTTGWAGSEGREIYIKRLIDRRELSQRVYKLRVRTTKTGTRRPKPNFIFRLMSGGTVGQTQVIRSGAQLDNVVSGQRDYVFYIANVEDVAASISETEFDTFDLTILGLDGFDEYDVEVEYARGDIVLYQNKLYRSLIRQNLGNNPDGDLESWGHTRLQQEGVAGAAVEPQNAFVTSLLDKDDGSATMGLVRDDYDSTTQNLTLRAINRFLEILGYDQATRDTVLVPQAEVDRLYLPNSLPTPSGGAALLSNNWPVEFNRSSLIRASGHTWDYVGYFNYSKAVPSRQTSILQEGNRISAITNETYGGRVYAIGMTEDGEIFQSSRVDTDASFEEPAEFETTSGSVVSSVFQLQVGDCTSPDPQQSWLSTDNLKICEDIELTTNTVIRNRFSLPQGVRSAYGDGTLGNVNGALYGFARPATISEINSMTDVDNYLTSYLLHENRNFEIGKISYFAATQFVTELYNYYLVCDGSSVAKLTYPKLYNFLRGVTYNQDTAVGAETALYGEDATTFVLPDLRGRFLRGYSGALEPRGINAPANSLDPGRVFATYQDDEFASHDHNISDPGHVHVMTVGRESVENEQNQVTVDRLNGGDVAGTWARNTNAAATGITAGFSGGAETRPDNIALLPVIRYA